MGCKNKGYMKILSSNDKLNLRKIIAKNKLKRAELRIKKPKALKRKLRLVVK